MKLTNIQVSNCKWTNIKLKNLSQKSNYINYPLLGYYGVFDNYPIAKSKIFKIDLSYTNSTSHYGINYIPSVLEHFDKNTPEYSNINFLTRIRDIETLFSNSIEINENVILK